MFEVGLTEQLTSPGGEGALAEGDQQLPAKPVRLFVDREDPSVGKLQVLSPDQPGLLFRLCELLTSHGIDIGSAQIRTEDGIVNNCFELRTSRPSDFADAMEWCRELEELLDRRVTSRGAPDLQGSLASVSKRLSVNPDLISVVSFTELPKSIDGELASSNSSGSEIRYSLELEGINQAGLLTYSALVLCRCGFSVVSGNIYTHEGHILDSFELSTTNPEAENLLRSYLDMPVAGVQSKDEPTPLPFHATPSDANLQDLMQMWGKTSIPNGASFTLSSPRISQVGSDPDLLDGQVSRLVRVASTVSDMEQSSAQAGSEDEAAAADAAAALLRSSRGGLRGAVEAPATIKSPPDRHEAVVSSALRKLFPRWSSYLPCSVPESPGEMSGEDSGASSSISPTGRARRKMSVQFANGDVYTGKCTLFEDGEKRHGLGTYVYSSGTHETYKQYRGQWREDKKHGYGVLFYRNGGVYVGQWEENQKQGLGVLLDHTSEGQDAAAMPTYRYEGQWQEDHPHGLGAEERNLTSYFGHFQGGVRRGRGVRMNLTKLGAEGCEVLTEKDQEPRALMAALDLELQALDARPEFNRLQRLSAPHLENSVVQDDSPADFPRAATCHFANSAQASMRTPLTELVFSSQQPATSHNPLHHVESGSSTSSNAAQTRSTPISGRFLPRNPSNNDMPRNPSLGDFGTPATPLMQPGSAACFGGGGGGGGLFAHQRQGSDGSAATVVLGRSSSGQWSDQQLYRSPQQLHSTTGVHGPSSEQQPGHASNGGHGSDGQNSSHSRSSGSGKGSPNRLRIDSGMSGASGITQAAAGTAGGSVVFSLWEENDLLSDLLSPSKTTRLGHDPIPEESFSRELGSARTGESLGLGRRRLPSKTSSDPWLPPSKTALGTEVGGSSSSSAAAGAPVEAIAEDACTPGSSAGDPLCSRLRASDSKAPRPLRRSPLLWCEDELAAFIACLGINLEVCAHVRQQKIKGVAHLLEMSNSQLRRSFGLRSPVERLVVRQSLKRLLDTDRWEHNVRGQKVGDILSDSVLSRFIVPVEELTLVTKISQGGYGTVYRGILQPSVDRAGGKFLAHKSHAVAVKDMKGERRVRLYELLKEACVMASLSHPNICTFVGVCTDATSRKHYIISELMDCSLFDLIHQPFKLRWHGELTISLVVDLSSGICAGIVYLHTTNLVHADMKSSNILIDYSNSWHLVPRICDFGHAAVRTHPSPHHRCGTPHWAGPEVLRGEALGPAADIYSFGVIMWEMLAQKLPHKGLSFSQVLASVGWAGWTPDMSLLPELPREVLHLIRECLNFAPSDRPRGKDVHRRVKRFPKQARLKAMKMLATYLS